jgi:lipoprotein NlpD
MGATAANWVSRIWVVLALTLLLTACQHTPVYAPVADLSTSVSRPATVVSVKNPVIYQQASLKSQRNTFIVEPKATQEQAAWVWPANGRILSVFGEGRKGVNIGGKEKDSVRAASAGKVVYAGGGLRGYGNLIIIKHNNHYLSAYAHNRALMVKVGDWVKMGQKIAEMGHTGTNKVMLHFEVRRDGKPVNPMQIRGIMN